MSTSRTNVVALATVGILLPIILVPFYTLAAPTIAQEFARSPTASTPDSPPTGTMTRKEIFDLVFALAFFLLIIGSYAWLGRCFPSDPLDVVVDEPRVRRTYRAFKDMLAFLRLDTLLQRLANAIIGPQTTTTTVTNGGGTLPSTQITSPRSPAPNNDTRPGGVTATPDPATTSGHHNIAHPPPV